MEFLLVFLICPAIVLVASIIGFILIKKWFVMPALTFIVFIILTYTVFNESFFIWVVIYTILSIIVSVIMNVIIKIYQKEICSFLKLKVIWIKVKVKVFSCNL